MLKTVFPDFLPRIPFIFISPQCSSVRKGEEQRKKKKEKLSTLKSEMSSDSEENCKDHMVPQLTFT